MLAVIKINNLIYGLYIVGIKFWAIPVFLFRDSILRVFLVYFFFLLFLQHKQNFLVRAFWGSQTFFALMPLKIPVSANLTFLFTLAQMDTMARSYELD